VQTATQKSDNELQLSKYWKRSGKMRIHQMIYKCLA